MQNKEPQFEILRMAPENTNSVLVSRGSDCVIFDAWGSAGDWADMLSQRGLNLRAIYSTHGHSDHISAAPDLSDMFDVPWYLNSADDMLVLWGNPILDFFELPNINAGYKPFSELSVGSIEILPDIKMNVIAAPGHSAGGMMFYFPDFGILITGDTLFRDGVGRYDLPGANIEELHRSVLKIYDMNLPDETFVVHGHGLDSTIAILKSKNPYFSPDGLNANVKSCGGCCCKTDGNCNEDCDKNCRNN